MWWMLALAQISNPSGPAVDVTALQAQIAAANARAAAAETAAATASSTASAAATAAAGTVKQVNGLTPNASGAVTVPVPTAATTMPPAVSDSSTLGTMTTMYALANHTHASKARRTIATSAADGSYTYNYSANPFTNPPICTAVAEVAAGVTDVVNVQVIGTPTVTSASFLVNRTQRTVASLLGLTVLSVPATVGATRLHIICLEP